ncbi:MAG: transcription-repair coupling factor, partial [Actinobacteria bacterium]|nr:transcription-repair coupling factor [Actinomycetota bacterium]
MRSEVKALEAVINKYLLDQDYPLVAPAAIHSLLAAVASNEHPLLLVTSSTRKADELTAELKSYLPSTSISNFPPWETLPHERLSPKSDTVTNRFKALNEITSNQSQIAVTSIRALLQPIIANDLKETKLSLVIGQEKSLSELAKQLSTFGFARVDLVERRGEFAVRGGIVDLFPADHEHPVRVDYFGDEIEELSYFSISDQRRITKIEQLQIYPCRELIIDAQIKSKAIKLGEGYPQIKDLTEKIQEGIYFEGIESLAAGLVNEYKSLIKYLPAKTQIWLIDQPRLTSRAIDLLETNQEFLEAAWSNLAWSNLEGSKSNEKQSPIDLSKELNKASFFTLDSIISESKADGFSLRALNLYQTDPNDLEIEEIIEIESFGNDYEAAISQIKEWFKDGYKITFSALGLGTLNRFHELLNQADLPNSITSSESSVIHLIQSAIANGFISNSEKIVFLTEKDISGQRASDKDLARMPSRRKKSIDPLLLIAGDYVVHEQHGVGRYVELINRTTNGVTREYLVLE